MSNRIHFDQNELAPDGSNLKGKTLTESGVAMRISTSRGDNKDPKCESVWIEQVPGDKKGHRYSCQKRGNKGHEIYHFDCIDCKSVIDKMRYQLKKKNQKKMKIAKENGVSPPEIEEMGKIDQHRFHMVDDEEKGLVFQIASGPYNTFNVHFCDAHDWQWAVAKSDRTSKTKQMKKHGGNVDEMHDSFMNHFDDVTGKDEEKRIDIGLKWLPIEGKSEVLKRSLIRNKFHAHYSCKNYNELNDYYKLELTDRVDLEEKFLEDPEMPHQELEESFNQRVPFVHEIERENTGPEEDQHGKIIVFAAFHDFIQLANCSEIHCDSKFDRLPKIFRSPFDKKAISFTEQYTIIGLIEGITRQQFVPLIVALLETSTEADYEKYTVLFKFIFKKCDKLSSGPFIQKNLYKADVSFDYWTKSIGVWQQILPNCTVGGSLFRFKEDLFKKIVELKLENLYKQTAIVNGHNYGAFHEFVQLLIGLCFVPAEWVNDIYDDIIINEYPFYRETHLSTAITKLIKYFEMKWLGRSPKNSEKDKIEIITMWNHYSRIGPAVRTNNVLAAFYRLQRENSGDCLTGKVSCVAYFHTMQQLNYYLKFLIDGVLSGIFNTPRINKWIDADLRLNNAKRNNAREIEIIKNNDLDQRSFTNKTVAAYSQIWKYLKQVSKLAGLLSDVAEIDFVDPDDINNDGSPVVKFELPIFDSVLIPHYTGCTERVRSEILQRRKEEETIVDYVKCDDGFLPRKNAVKIGDLVQKQQLKQQKPVEDDDEMVEGEEESDEDGLDEDSDVETD